MFFVFSRKIFNLIVNFQSPIQSHHTSKRMQDHTDLDAWLMRCMPHTLDLHQLTHLIHVLDHINARIVARERPRALELIRSRLGPGALLKVNNCATIDQLIFVLKRLQALRDEQKKACEAFALRHR